MPMHLALGSADLSLIAQRAAAKACYGSGYAPRCTGARTASNGDKGEYSAWMTWNARVQLLHVRPSLTSRLLPSPGAPKTDFQGHPQRTVASTRGGVPKPFWRVRKCR